MAKVEDKILDHDYDGIKEYDNPLPSWWVWLFIGSVVFSAFYVPYLHWGPGKLPREKYRESMEAYYEAHPPVELASAEELEAMLADEARVAEGAEIFAIRCAACHAKDGGGLVGPNLTDDYTLHGYGMEPIAKTILDGVPDKGMQAWNGVLSIDEIYSVSVYVHGLRGTTPAKAKEAQGDEIAD